MNKRKGSLYIYTFIIFMICISLMSILLILNDRDNIAIGEAETSGIMPIINDGFEYSLELITNDLYSYDFSSNLTYISKRNIEYILTDDNKYKGKFSYKNNALNLGFRELYFKDFKDISYRYTVTDKYTYEVKIDIYRSGNKWVVEVDVENDDLNINEKLKRNVDLNVDAYFNPMLKYKNIPEYLSGIYVVGNAINLSNYIQGINSPFIDIENMTFSYNNPILITENSEIDISNFYLKDAPLNTIIIAKENVSLFASDPRKNIFKGTIISLKDMNFLNPLVLNGIVYVGGDINGENLSFNAQPIKLLDFTSDNYETYYKILDALKITNFKEAVKVNIGKDILHNLNFDGFKEIIVDNLEMEYK